MNKRVQCVFKHKEEEFYITVELYSLAERRMGGMIKHHICIDHKISNWGKSLSVDPGKLLESINKLKKDAINYIDGVNNKTVEEQLLLDLGFE